MHRSLLPLVAAFAAAACPPALAADWYTGAAVVEPRDAWIVAIDSSATLSSQGSQFAMATVTAAPVSSLVQSGLRLRFDGLLGSYRTGVGGGRSVIGDQEEVAALAGYAWVWPEAVFSAFVGLNLRRNELLQLDAGVPSDRTEVGLKTALDYYARPTVGTMVHATGSYSTTFNAYYGRVRGGIAAFAGGYVGPEFALLGDDYYRQWRVGAHLSGMQFGPVQFGLSAGYLHDHAQKGGLYTTVDMRTGF